MVKNAGIITLTLIIAVLLMLLNKGCNDAKMVTYNYNAALGELNKYKNSSGQEISTIVALQADYHELQQMNDRLNGTISDLKKQVNKKSETVIIHEVHTRDTIFIETTVIDSSKCHLQAHYNDEWAAIDVDINKDSASVNYSVTNRFVHKQQWRRKNIFATPVLEGSVMNLNPHTSTQEYISYKKKAPKRTGVKVALLVAGLVSGVLIAK
jgi:uncharacterized membrane protein YciS (DUF1049 family)